MHAMRVRFVVICGLFAHNIFPHLINGTIFGKKLKNKIRVLIFCATLCETFLILRRIRQDMIKNMYRSSCKVLVILILRRIRQDMIKNVYRSSCKVLVILILRRIRQDMFKKYV